MPHTLSSNMFSNKDNMFGYTSSSSSSPWTDATTSWESSPSHNGGLAYHDNGPSLSGLDRFALATTPGHLFFDQSSGLLTPPSSDPSFYEAQYNHDFVPATFPVDQAFPTTDFILFPDAPQGYAGSFTSPHQPQVALEPSVSFPKSSAATRATRQLAYVDKATSTAHDDTAERPNKRIKITRSKPVIEKKKKPRHHCKLGKCSRSFGRNSDLLRHQQDWHGLSDKVYQCEAAACLHRTRRNDKMKEHCQKMHGHLKGSEEFAVISGLKEGMEGVGGTER